VCYMHEGRIILLNISNILSEYDRYNNIIILIPRRAQWFLFRCEVPILRPEAISISIRREALSSETICARLGGRSSDIILHILHIIIIVCVCVCTWELVELSAVIVRRTPGSPPAWTAGEINR